MVESFWMDFSLQNWQNSFLGDTGGLCYGVVHKEKSGFTIKETMAVSQQQQQQE